MSEEAHLADTNFAIAIFNGERQAIERATSLDQLYVPALVLGELFFGAVKSGRPRENLERVRDLSSTNTIVACDEEAAYWYGVIRDATRRTGRSIPHNDAWVAASARQYGLPILTRDKHFNGIQGVTVSPW